MDGLNESGVKRPSNRHYALYLVPDIVETRRNPPHLLIQDVDELRDTRERVGHSVCWRKA